MSKLAFTIIITARDGADRNDMLGAVDHLFEHVCGMSELHPVSVEVKTTNRDSEIAMAELLGE